MIQIVVTTIRLNPHAAAGAELKQTTLQLGIAALKLFHFGRVHLRMA
jgi:hypothetical protein